MTKPSRRNFLRLSLFSDEFSSGFSLVELLVSIGIMGVMLAAFSAMQANQFREVRALNEQLSAMTAQNSAMAILSDGQVCQFMLASQTFNSTLPPDSTAAGSEVLSTAIPVRPSSPVNVLAVGDPASPLSNTLKVTAIKTRDFTPDPSDANLYKANIRVQFNGPPDTVRPIKDAIIPVVITTTNGGTPSATIQSCKPSFGAGNQNYLSYWASTTVLGSTTMYNDPGTGNIGIGTTTPTMPFDVSGIRIGNSSTCLPGALRYNSALTGSMEFCDNTGAWKAAFSVSCAPWASGNGGGPQFVSCPAGKTMTGGSCIMARGGDGRVINAQTCRPAGVNTMTCDEGNGGTCQAFAICCG